MGKFLSRASVTQGGIMFSKPFIGVLSFLAIFVTFASVNAVSRSGHF